MTVRTRKLVGSFILIVGLTAYIVAVSTIGTQLLSHHWAVQTIFYAVAGIAWAFPLKGFLAWMNRPDD